MRGRRAVFAVACLLAVTACGDDEPATPGGVERPTTTSTTSPPDGSSTTAAPAPAPPPAEGAVEVRAEVPTRIAAGPHTWQFQLTNVSDAPVMLTFPTAQRGDAVIQDDDAASVHRWSRDRFFTQQVHEVALAPGETETIELADDLTGVEPGYYRVVLSPAVVGEVEPLDRSIRIVAPGT